MARPSAATSTVSVPPAVAEVVAVAVQAGRETCVLPTTTSMTSPAPASSLVQTTAAASAAAKSVPPCGRVETLYADTALATEAPEIGAVFCSAAAPPPQCANRPTSASASSTSVPWPVGSAPSLSRPSSTSAAASSTTKLLAKLSIESTRSATAPANVAVVAVDATAPTTANVAARTGMSRPATSALAASLSAGALTRSRSEPAAASAVDVASPQMASTA